MSNTTTPSLSYRFSPRATLAALGIRLQGLNLFGPVRDHVHITCLGRCVTTSILAKKRSPTHRCRNYMMPLSRSWQARTAS